jgi:hypothetical protein
MTGDNTNQLEIVMTYFECLASILRFPVFSPGKSHETSKKDKNGSRADDTIDDNLAWGNTPAGQNSTLPDGLP